MFHPYYYLMQPKKTANKGGKNTTGQWSGGTAAFLLI